VSGKDSVRFDRAIPGASALLESLRGVGYSPWTAIADLVDNSIASQAKRIWIEFLWRGAESSVRIIDDGFGMSEVALVSAMRPGSRSPRDRRSPGDLGRFGLGLKTASLSQCRVLTVSSRVSAAEAAIRRWDLDHVASIDDWQLLVGPPADREDEASIPADLESGTVVLWTRLDRLVGDAGVGDVEARRRFFETARHVENHLAMTHHRFLAGSHPRIELYVGTSPAMRVKPWDPFMQNHPATIRTPPERISLGAAQVEVQGFVLPHRDQLTTEELEEGAGPEGWLAHEGFFVYRADRLVVYGGWLGLGSPRRWARDELHRLARIRVDLANSDDDEWKIDIRKSIAIPPQGIRDRLRGLAERVREESRQILAHRGGRGARAAAEPLVRAWKAIESPRGVSYRIDRSHPAVRRVLEAQRVDAAWVDQMLQVIEATVPVQRIWMDAAEQAEIRGAGRDSEADPVILAALRSLYTHLVRDLGVDSQEAKQKLRQVEPFNVYPDEIDALSEQEIQK
jgi:hypothetical protein